MTSDEEFYSPIEGDDELASSFDQNTHKREKKKANKKPLAGAFSSILNDDEDDKKFVPVPSMEKAIRHKIQKQKLEKRAKNILKKELKKKRDSAHKPVQMDNNEKFFKKIATKGAVQLFNAIYRYQQNHEPSDQEQEEEGNIKRENPKNSSSISKRQKNQRSDKKDKFLELLKTKGK